jgi:hypothetical protein
MDPTWVTRDGHSTPLKRTVSCPKCDFNIAPSVVNSGTKYLTIFYPSELVKVI